MGQCYCFLPNHGAASVLFFCTEPWIRLVGSSKLMRLKDNIGKKTTCGYMAKISVPVLQEQICLNVFKTFYLLDAKRSLFMLNKLEKLLKNISSIWKCEPCTAAKRSETCGVMPSKWWSHELEKLRYRSLAITVFPKMWKCNRENTRQCSVFPARSDSFGHDHGPRTKRCKRDQNNIFKQSEFPLPLLWN